MTLNSPSPSRANLPKSCIRQRSPIAFAITSGSDRRTRNQQRNCWKDEVTEKLGLDGPNLAALVEEVKDIYERDNSSFA